MPVARFTQVQHLVRQHICCIAWAPLVSVQGVHQGRRPAAQISTLHTYQSCMLGKAGYRSRFKQPCATGTMIAAPESSAGLSSSRQLIACRTCRQCEGVRPPSTNAKSTSAQTSGWTDKAEADERPHLGRITCSWPGSWRKVDETLT
ncbi:hypothetical protein MMC29_003702 [Sticta canariensis]|nr:hypothetical protein [Sticta canariensis]